MAALLRRTGSTTDTSSTGRRVVGELVVNVHSSPARPSIRKIPAGARAVGDECFSL